MPLDVVVSQGAVFSLSENTLVKQIKESPTLRYVHQGLVATCSKHLHDPTYRQPYHPNISYPEQFNVASGQSINIGGFCIAACSDERWQVLEKIGFKGEPNR